MVSEQFKSRFQLSWSHYVFLLKIEDENEHKFYEIEASKENWSLPELRRQFDSSSPNRKGSITKRQGVYIGQPNTG